MNEDAVVYLNQRYVIVKYCAAERKSVKAYYLSL